jgi:hypothetical protein
MVQRSGPRFQRWASRVGLLIVVGLPGCERGDSNETADAAADTTAIPTMSAPVAHALIQEPQEGAEVDGKSVMIVLGVENLALAPAGDTTPGTGHHHLFINTPVVNAGEGIPVGAPGIVHLGKAQTSHELTNLAPGEYTVIAVIGDLVHRRVDPQVLDTVRFRVK